MSKQLAVTKVRRVGEVIGMWRDGTLEIYHRTKDTPHKTVSCSEEKLEEQLAQVADDPLVCYFMRG